MPQPISEVFERCQRRYPTVRLPVESFQARIEEILSAEMKLAGDNVKCAAFAKIHHEDLYLAMACATDDRVAWEHFADDYVPLLRHFAAQVCKNSVEAEDLAQEIAAKLLREKKRLAGYNGRCSLAGWLRVAVAHAAIDRFRRTSRLTSLDELQENSAIALQSDENAEDEESLDSRWGPVITGVAEECLRARPARDRMLLSLYYLQGVSLKDIGRQFGIHEATASRWLERMRRDIRKQIESDLRKKHGLSPREIDSLWKWVSPLSLAKSIDGSLPGPGIIVPNTTPIRKKTAIDENSGVIEKEELQ